MRTLLAAALSAVAASPAGTPAPTLISLSDARHGVASFGNSVGRTGDGGRTWRLVSLPRVRTLTAVRATRVVWAAVAAPGRWCGGIQLACDEHLVQSSDGGASWRSSKTRLLAPVFADRTHGWAFRRATRDEFGPLVATHDGGRTWRPVHDPCPRAMAKTAALVTPSHGWVLCLSQPGAGEQGKAIFETRDGARRWRVVTNTSFGQRRSTRNGLPLSGYPLGIDVTDAGMGLLWEARGDTFRTANGGRTWTKLRLTSPEVAEVVSASVVTDRLAFVLLRNGAAGRLELLRSNDGLRHWRLVRAWPIR